MLFPRMKKMRKNETELVPCHYFLCMYSVLDSLSYSFLFLSTNWNIRLCPFCIIERCWLLYVWTLTAHTSAVAIKPITLAPIHVRIWTTFSRIFTLLYNDGNEQSSFRRKKKLENEMARSAPYGLQTIIVEKGKRTNENVNTLRYNKLCQSKNEYRFVRSFL